MHAAVLTAFLFALTGVCATQSSRLLGAARANAWRLLIALIFLSVWAHGWGQGFGGGVLHIFMIAGGIGFGFGGWCMFQALRRIGSTLSLLIVECAAAVFATVIGWVWLGASLSPFQVIFASLILAGVVVGVSPSIIPNLSRGMLWIGCGFATCAALLQAISFNLSRMAFTLLQQNGHALDPLSAAYQRLLGGLLMALVLWALTRLISRRVADICSKVQHHTSPLPASVWVVLNALFGPVLGVTCMLWAISLVPNPGLVQAVAATATLLTVPFASRLEMARPGLPYYLGCLLALSGTAGLILLPVH